MDEKRKSPKKPPAITGKQKYLYLGAIAVAVIAIVLIVVFGIKQQDESKPNPDKDQAPIQSGGIATEPGEEIIPTIPGPPVTELPPVEAGNNVTINQVEIPDGTKINRDPIVTSNDPEYIEANTGGGPYISEEGRVYKNDRTISIDVFNYDRSTIETYTFGLASGTYNRFLYLNPVRQEADGTIKQCIVRFTPSNGLKIEAPQQFFNDSEMFNRCNSFSIRRAMDQRSAASYENPMHPGTVWYTDKSLDEPVYIDVIVYSSQSAIGHILRLWIDKDENGCYYFADIDNCNLLDDAKDTPFDEKEIYHIYQMAAKDMYDSDKIHLAIISEREPSIEEFIIDYRARGEGCYYPYFIPGNSSVSKVTADHDSLGIMAVTLRNHAGGLTVTLYYHILIYPREGTHGSYAYLGRDYNFLASIETLHQQGYPGYD